MKDLLASKIKKYIDENNGAISQELSLIVAKELLDEFYIYNETELFIPPNEVYSEEEKAFARAVEHPVDPDTAEYQFIIDMITPFIAGPIPWEFAKFLVDISTAKRVESTGRPEQEIVKSVYFPLKDILNWLNKLKDHNPTGIKVFFGEYPEIGPITDPFINPEFKKYMESVSNLRTIILRAMTTDGQGKIQYIPKEEGVVSFDIGSICPPYCKPPESDEFK